MVPLVPMVPMVPMVPLAIFRAVVLLTPLCSLCSSSIWFCGGRPRHALGEEPEMTSSQHRGLEVPPEEPGERGAGSTS